MAEITVRTYNVPSVTENSDRYDTEYRRSPKWNPDTGDFERDARYSVQEADGHDGYKTWCSKMTMTERFECLGYRGVIGDQLGVELEKAMKYSNDHATVESMMRRTITEAIMTNPRTISVGDFEFEWSEDSLKGSCRIQAREMDDFTLEF